MIYAETTQPPREITDLAQAFHATSAERIGPTLEGGGSWDGDSDTTVPGEEGVHTTEFGMIKLREGVESPIDIQDEKTGLKLGFGEAYVSIHLKQLPREERTHTTALSSLTQAADYLRGQEYAEDTVVGAVTYGRLALAAERTFGFNTTPILETEGGDPDPNLTPTLVHTTVGSFIDRFATIERI